MPNAIQGLLADPRGEMQATPRKNKLMGLLADALTAANDYAQRPDAAMPGGKANPVLGLLADAVALPSMATTAQRVSYGEPLTNGLRGSKAFLKPETADVAMMAPISPRNALAALGVVGGMADTGAMASFKGALPRNNMQAEYLRGLISSQRYLDRDIVAQKIRDKNFEVKVTPWFELEGDQVRAITDGHHALEAAIRSGNKPRFITQSKNADDRIGLLEKGSVQDYLEAAYHDSPWYYFASKADIY